VRALFAPGRFGLGREVQGHEAARAKALRRVGSKGRSAARTVAGLVGSFTHHS
jgi:hypothetical protein